MHTEGCSPVCVFYIQEKQSGSLRAILRNRLAVRLSISITPMPMTVPAARPVENFPMTVTSFFCYNDSIAILCGKIHRQTKTFCRNNREIHAKRLDLQAFLVYDNTI